MNPSSIITLSIILLATVLLGICMLMVRRRKMSVFRSIPAMRVLNQMIGNAVEEGKPIHISLGSGYLLDRQSTISISGLEVLRNMAGITHIGDKPLLSTSGEGGLMILSQDNLRRVAHRADRIATAMSRQAILAGATPTSYIAGVMGTLLDTPVAGSLYIGRFDSMGVLLTSSLLNEGHVLAATDSLAGQTAFLVSADEALVGEDGFAAAAYSGPSISRSASLIVQDILRWFFILLLIALILLRSVGVI